MRERTVLMRVDGSESLGMGHVARCAALAANLKTAGFRVAALVARAGLKIYEPLRASGVRLSFLPAGCGLDKDADAVASWARSLGARRIVVDRSHRETLRRPVAFIQYLKRISDEAGSVALIDGLERDSLAFYRPVETALAILPYYGVRLSKHRFSSKTKRLIGPKYFILRPGLADVRKKAVRFGAANVLVTMGGSDPSGATEILAEELLSRAEVRLRLVLGDGFSAGRRRALERIARSARCSLERGAAGVSRGLLWADVAVTSGGLTKFEAAACGVPSVTVTHFEREDLAARKFKKAGCSVYGGRIQRVKRGHIAELTVRLLADAPLRGKMSKRGRALIDGRGARRVALEIGRMARG